MTKPEYKIQLGKEIKALEAKAEERKEWCIKHVDASNYDEVSSDYRAIMVKIEAKRQQLKHLDSTVEVLERNIRITPGLKLGM